VSGVRGLATGDQVTHINSCRVSSTYDWTSCIRGSLTENISGYCIPMDTLHQQDVSKSGWHIHHKLINTLQIWLNTNFLWQDYHETIEKKMLRICCKTQVSILSMRMVSASEFALHLWGAISNVHIIIIITHNSLIYPCISNQVFSCLTNHLFPCIINRLCLYFLCNHPSNEWGMCYAVCLNRVLNLNLRI